MKFRALLFDYDGIIARTMQDNFNAWSAALAPYGINVAKERYYLLEGMRPQEVASVLLDEGGRDIGTADEVARAKDRHYREHARVTLYPDAAGIVSAFKKKGYLLALVSGASAARLRESGVDHVMRQFDTIVSADDIKCGKPDPEPYLVAMERLAASPGECLAIENAPLGIQSAKRAGAMCLAVCTTLGKKHLQEADVIVDQLSDVMATVQSLESSEVHLKRKDSFAK